ncbi:MAG: molybdenum cofactor guanylyltransferase [Defluviitaleaceae bacterium]|nr:molybdenum cofactor guanylyltransferase [Defluviitaleaceae bacterium]
MKNFGDAFILCGGKSSRMGFDKALMKIDDEYVIKIMHSKLEGIFDNIRLSALCGEKFASFCIDIVEDIHKGSFGPAAAIHTALSAAESRYIFVAAVDMPLLNIEHIKHMQKTIEELLKRGESPHALVPKCGQFSEVLYAFYSIDTIGTFEKHLQQQSYRMRDILLDMDVVYLNEEESRLFDPKLAMFTNLNYVEDLKKLDQNS